MTQNQLLVTIIIICSCFFIGSIVLDHGNFFLKGLCRGITGLALMVVVNIVLGALGIAIPVGINVFNFIVASILGIPGVMAIYGIGLWQMIQ